MDPLRRLSAAERFARARELRHNPTPAERHAWTLLRNRGILGLKFRRQQVLHGFIVDFYCTSERIVIELEGNVHDTEAQRGYDQARTGFLEGAGYRVIRVRNRDVSREHLEEVLRERLGLDRQFPLSRRERGSGGEDRNGDGVRSRAHIGLATARTA